MSIEKIKLLWKQDEIESILHAGGELVEEDDWTQDHKYQNKTSIVKFEDKYYQINESRSGSYHTDWYYNDTEIMEVERHEKVVTKTEVSYKQIVGQSVTIAPKW